LLMVSSTGINTSPKTWCKNGAEERSYEWTFRDG
jgi:hypothetical protein